MAPVASGSRLIRQERRVTSSVGENVEVVKVLVVLTEDQTAEALAKCCKCLKEVGAMSVFAEPVMTDPDGRRVSRLRADEGEDLHQFVELAGLKNLQYVESASASSSPYYELSPRQRKVAVRTGALDLDWRQTLQQVRVAAVEQMRRDTLELLSQPRLRRGAPLGAALFDAMPDDGAGPLQGVGARDAGNGYGRSNNHAGFSRRSVSSFTLSKTGMRDIRLTPRKPAADRYAPCEPIALVPLGR